MNKNEKLWKIIFLDIDGVLNGNDNILIGFLLHIGLPGLAMAIHKILKLEDTYDIHERRVKLLAEICNKTGAAVVLTSSWREQVWKYWWVRHNPETMEEAPYMVRDLIRLLEQYNIPIKDITPRVAGGSREDEILKWLHKHNGRVAKYIILDDEYDHLGLFYDNNSDKSNLILTSDCTPRNEIPLGAWYCRDGLRRCHVEAAIKKLK